MKITEVKIYPVKKQETDGRLKAYVTIVFENAFIVRDLKVILGNDNKLFVSMPSRRSKYGSKRPKPGQAAAPVAKKGKKK